MSASPRPRIAVGLALSVLATACAVKINGKTYGSGPLGGTATPSRGASASAPADPPATKAGKYPPGRVARPSGKKPTARAKQVIAGDGFTCALLDGGAVRCWGRVDPFDAQREADDATNVAIGDDELPQDAPVIALSGKAVQLAAGELHACALLSGGQVQCWGARVYGPADRTRAPQTPVTIGLGEPATQVVAGRGFACALLTSGTIQCWGKDRGKWLPVPELRSGGREGIEIGDDEPLDDTTRITLARHVAELRAGETTTCARFDDGGVVCWGYQWDRGGDLAQRPDVVVGARVARLTGGGMSDLALAVTTTGAVRGLAGHLAHWLRDDPNGRDQIDPRVDVPAGYGDPRNTPTSVGDLPSPAKLVEVAAGHYGTYGITADGALWQWGANEPAGESLDVRHARRLDVGGKVTQIAVGLEHVCALLAGGGVRCWGDNYWGQLGYGVDRYQQVVPKDVGDVPL